MNEFSNEADRDFEEIYNTYCNQVYEFIYATTNDTEDTEDLMVEAFVTAYYAWEQFKLNRQIAVSDWLMAIARDCCENPKKRQRHPLS